MQTCRCCPVTSQLPLAAALTFLPSGLGSGGSRRHVPTRTLQRFKVAFESSSSGCRGVSLHSFGRTSEKAEVQYLVQIWLLNSRLCFPLRDDRQPGVVQALAHLFATHFEHVGPCWGILLLAEAFLAAAVLLCSSPRPEDHESSHAEA